MNSHLYTISGPTTTAAALASPSAIFSEFSRREKLLPFHFPLDCGTIVSIITILKNASRHVHNWCGDGSVFLCSISLSFGASGERVYCHTSFFARAVMEPVFFFMWITVNLSDFHRYTPCRRWFLLI